FFGALACFGEDLCQAYSRELFLGATGPEVPYHPARRDRKSEISFSFSMLLKKPRTPPSWASCSLCWFHHRNSNPPELYKNDKQVQADHGQGCAPKDVEQRPPAKPALDLLFLLPRTQKCGFALVFH